MFRVVPGATKVEVIARPAVEVVGVPTTQDTVIGACHVFFLNLYFCESVLDVKIFVLCKLHF